MHQPKPKPNYQPSHGTGLFARGVENHAIAAASPKLSTPASTTMHAVLTDITNSFVTSDSLLDSSSDAGSVAANGADHSPAVSNSDSSTGTAITNSMSSAPDCGSSNTSLSDDTPAAPTSTASIISADHTSTGPTRPSITSEAITGNKLLATPTNSSSTTSANTSAAAISTLTSGEPSLVSSAADSRGDVEPMPPKKKKRSEMGTEERRIMRQAVQDCSEKLSADIIKLLEEQEELFAKYAELNNISVDWVKKLAYQVPSIKAQKEASNYNILVYFKGKELNISKLIASSDYLFLLTLNPSLWQRVSCST